jgi:16S rRNA (guanine527-N7)-methyltransferase
VIENFMSIDDDLQVFMHTLQAQSVAYGVASTADVIRRLGDYYQLLMHWNDRLHLVAPCSPEEFAERHVLESLYLLRYVPEKASIIDIGSGGGLPIIPCLIARPGLRATLIESSKRKAVFLREALRITGSLESSILAERFEDLTEPSGDFVTCRALDRFESKLETLVDWSPAGSTLLLYGGHSLKKKLSEMSLEFRQDLLPRSDKRYLFRVDEPAI